MKPIYKYFAHAGLTAALCVLMAVPSMAQRGGGGGHGGGGGGGGHFSSGGGGGGGRSGGGFSGASHVSGSYSGARAGVGSRAGFSSRGAIGSRAGAAVPRGYVRSAAVGGSRGLANRGYVGGSYGHSYAGGGAYARPYGWGGHGGFFYAHGYYGRYYYPFLGLGYGFLPWGYYPFWWGDAWFYYSGGLFYQYDNDQYTVVEPPVGAEIKSLPTDAKSIVIDGQQYYEINGVYYAPVTKDDGTVAYQVMGKDGELNTGATGAASVTPKVGDVTETLPAGCKKVKLNGNTLYVSDDGIYYQAVTDSNNKTVYKIVALEADENSGN